MAVELESRQNPTVSTFDTTSRTLASIHSTAIELATTQRLALASRLPLPRLESPRCFDSGVLRSQFPLENTHVQSSSDIRTNPGGQQKWSTPYSCALIVVVVFVVDGCLEPLGKTSTTGAIAGVVQIKQRLCVWNLDQLKNVDTALHFYNTKFSGSYNFPFSTTRTLFGLGDCCRISKRSSKNVTVGTRSSITANLQFVDLLAESNDRGNGGGDRHPRHRMPILKPT